MRRLRQAPREWWLVLAFGLYALVSAAFFVLNMPPYQNPDETNHLLRADHISRLHLTGERFDGGVQSGGAQSGGAVSPEIAQSGAAFDWPKFHPERKVTLEEYQRSAAKFGAAPVVVAFPNTAVYPPLFYAPSVVALWIGKQGRMSVVQTLYLGRLLTALASGACIALALALCVAAGLGGAAALLFLCATLPMSLELQSAVSQDGLLLGASALAAALLARARLLPTSGEFVALSILLALVISARLPYAPLAFALLFVRVPVTLRIAGAVFAVGVPTLWTAYANGLAGVPLTAQFDPAAQLHMLLDPMRTLRLLRDTIGIELPFYGRQLAGQLGWLDVLLPPWFYLVTSLVAALVAVCAVGLRGWVAAGLLLGAAGAFVAVLLAMDLISTPVGAPVIQGVQGRYFLPVVFLLGALGTSLRRHALGWLARGSLAVLPAVALGVTMRAVVVRYYLGP